MIATEGIEGWLRCESSPLRRSGLDLCWSFALVTVTDYLKAARAGEEAAGLC